VTFTTEPIQTLPRIQEASFARASAATRNAFPAERRMDGRALVSFLSAHRTCVLSTVRPDGRPHAAPVGYALVGTRFVFGSLPDAARVRNLRHQPYASLVISAEDGDGDGVVIAEGNAQIIPTLEATLEMREPFRDQTGSMPSWIGVIIAVTPERLLSYASAGWGRTPDE
jgi:PPOX class probable F420-dependent enzyme